jgi:DNA polymerase-1
VNWQNLPADSDVVRRAVVPKHPGWVLSDFDFGKIEPRLLAYFASKRGDDQLAGYIRAGRDPYKAVVSQMYAVSEAELTEAQYKRGKILFLSLMYGGGVRTIQEQFGIPQKEARALVKQFHDAWPIVRELQDDIVRVAQKRGYVRTPWGRHLHLPEFGEHRMLNTLIQGSAAHLLKRGLIRVSRFLKANPDLQSHMILTIHDSIDFDGPADEVEFLHLNVPGLMGGEPLIAEVVPILVEHEVSPRYWSEKFPYDEWKESL